MAERTNENSLNVLFFSPHFSAPELEWVCVCVCVSECIWMCLCLLHFGLGKSTKIGKRDEWMNEGRKDGKKNGTKCVLRERRGKTSGEKLCLPCEMTTTWRWEERERGERRERNIILRRVIVIVQVRGRSLFGVGTGVVGGKKTRKILRVIYATIFFLEWLKATTWQS